MQLILKNVSYTYPLENKKVIENVSFTFESGKVYGIIGENESGKTTLCHILRGFVPSLFKGTLTGDIMVNKKKLSELDLDTLANKIGYSFQNPFTQISGVKESVYEEIAYGMENLGVTRETMITKVTELIQLFKLEELIEKNPFELSGGQKQRVALASIMALDPDVIILDEPTSQLDPKSSEDIFEIVKLLKKQGKTIILVEHKVDLLAECCDEILLLQEGKIQLHGSVSDVFSNKKVLEYGGALPEICLFYLDYHNEIDAVKTVPLTVNQAYKLLKGQV